jgi:segregation and condensation protein A
LPVGVVACPRAEVIGDVAMAPYKVQFEVFEGPLDLLLYLVKKEEVDIYEVNLTRIAKEFIEYIDLMRELDLEVAGDFLVMATTLMLIKSRELLPVDQQVQTEDDEEAEDPRWELIRQLVEYKKFKDAAAQLQSREIEQEEIYPREPSPPQFEAAAPERRAEVSLFDLLAAVNHVLDRIRQREGPSEIFEDRWTVSEKIELLRRLIGEQGRIRFSDLFKESASRSEVVVTFLAVLELMRLRWIAAEQSSPFDEIEICRVGRESESPEGLGAAESAESSR